MRSRRLLIDTKDLIAMWEEQEGKCYYTGEPMTVIQGLGGHVMTNVSIDRVDSAKPYDRENIVLCCLAVNLMKNIMTLDELKLWCRRILDDKSTN